MSASALAFALGASVEQAQVFQSVYDSAVADPRWAVILGCRWQELSAASPDDDVTVPWANECHHQIADLLEQQQAPGTTIALRGATITCPTTIRLPCRHCGHMLESKFRGGRYRRTCGLCFAYTPAPPQHARGGLTLYKGGVYRHRRAGSSLGVEQYGQDVVCAHPDCLTLILSTRGDEEYCLQHQGKREQARRLRESLPAKHTRFVFTPAPGQNRVQYCRGPRSEEVIIETDKAHVAEDDAELLTLATLVATGALIVRP